VVVGRQIGSFSKVAHPAFSHELLAMMTSSENAIPRIDHQPLSLRAPRRKGPSS
jgi:hypothetical protein